MIAATLAERPLVHTLAPEELRAHMRRTYDHRSRFQREFGADAKDFGCRAHTDILRAEVIRLLGLKDIRVTEDGLERLHLHIGPEWKKYGLDDGVNAVSALLYDTDERFASCYVRFLKEAVCPHFPYPFYFQATPTIRVHCPGGENSHHYPRYHTDIGYGHPPEEINLWIPLTEPQPPQLHGFRRTDVAHSRAILELFGFDFASFIARAVNDKPFNFELHRTSPQVTTPLGEFTAFDSRCIHTGEPLEAHTRVSIDIRIIPVEDFEARTVDYQGVGRRKMLYAPGHAYHALSSGEL